MIFKKIGSKTKLIILISILGVLIVSYCGISLFNIYSTKNNNKVVLPNTYVEDFDLSGYTFKNSKEKLEFYSDNILSKKVILKANEKTYEYDLKTLGVILDVDKTIEQIKDYQNKLNYKDTLKSMNGKSNAQFDYIYSLDVAKLTGTLNDMKKKVDLVAVNGYFDTSKGVSYIKGIPGYSLNVNKSIETINGILLKEFKDGITIELVGDSLNAEGNDSYATIDTMTSSFVTDFMPNTYLRNINLNTALGYINGTVVEPGQIFSYCDKAGPFDKAGYVFYYEFVGNGVCQIATTTYNSALLGGLEIVKRYPHDKKSLYVDGGLDATVASYSSGWCVDMQFKNTYKYPIYIKAYSEGGRAHVEFWSNKDAKEGKEYKTSSVQIAPRGYESYLHTYKDGKEIETKKIATTWYTKS